MAILSKFLIASSLFSAVALAAPLVQRDIVTDIVTETVWTTLDVTTTIYDNAVPATAAPPMTTPTAMQMTAVETSTSTPTTLMPMATSTSTPASSAAAAQFFTTTTTTTPAAGLALTATTTMAAAAASATVVANSVSGSATADCEGQGDACVGDVTHWDGGVGACGNNVDSTTDLAIALPFAFMGTLSNTNPYCGRSVTLYNPTSGTTVQATVQDKCMGCVDRAIDCTDILFDQITDGLGNGRMSGIVWWLN
jgi:hypothetical protein